MTAGNPRARSCQACRLKSCETGLRRVQTYDSTAWLKASMPVAAVTAAGMLIVSSGSSNAIRQAALGSPHAIFMRDFGLAMRAYDWASLPVPEVVGTAIIGSMGRVALPAPQ